MIYYMEVVQTTLTTPTYITKTLSDWTQTTSTPIQVSTTLTEASYSSFVSTTALSLVKVSSASSNKTVTSLTTMMEPFPVLDTNLEYSWRFLAKVFLSVLAGTGLEIIRTMRNTYTTISSNAIPDLSITTPNWVTERVTESMIFMHNGYQMVSSAISSAVYAWDLLRSIIGWIPGELKDMLLWVLVFYLLFKSRPGLAVSNHKSQKQTPVTIHVHQATPMLTTVTQKVKSCDISHPLQATMWSKFGKLFTQKEGGTDPSMTKRSEDRNSHSKYYFFPKFRIANEPRGELLENYILPNMKGKDFEAERLLDSLIRTVDDPAHAILINMEKELPRIKSITDFKRFWIKNKISPSKINQLREESQEWYFGKSVNDKQGFFECLKHLAKDHHLMLDEKDDVHKFLEAVVHYGVLRKIPHKLKDQFIQQLLVVSGENQDVNIGATEFAQKGAWVNKFCPKNKMKEVKINHTVTKGPEYQKENFPEVELKLYDDTKIRAIIDTGASHSLIAESLKTINFLNFESTEFTVKTVLGKKKVKGRKTLLAFEMNDETYEHVFFVMPELTKKTSQRPEVSVILGMDFIEKNSIRLDELIGKARKKVGKEKETNVRQLVQEHIKQLLKDQKPFHVEQLKNPEYHEIKLKTKIEEITPSPYIRLSQSQKVWLYEEVDRLLEKGIIKETKNHNGGYSFPLVVEIAVTDDVKDRLQNSVFPDTKGKLHSSIGGMCWISKYMDHFSERIAPLQDLLVEAGITSSQTKKIKPKDHHLQAFNDIIQMNFEALKVYPFKAENEHKISIDASNIGAAAVLQQYEPALETWVPVKFTSHRFTGYQTRWSITMKEFFSIRMVFAKLSFYFIGFI